MKTVSSDLGLNGDFSLNNLGIKKRGRPPKKKEIMLPELPKPPQLTVNEGFQDKALVKIEAEMKTLSSDVNGDFSLKNVRIKKPGRPPKIKRGRPKRIMFPRLPKPPQLTFRRTSSRCFVSGCTNTDNWMFTLPEVDDLRERWLKFISRPYVTPEKKLRVCEVHFEPQMWKTLRDGQRVLLPDAFPTLCKPEPGNEPNGDMNFVDVQDFEDSEIYIESELLEPEIDVSEDPVFSPSVFTEKKSPMTEEYVCQSPAIKVEPLFPGKEEAVVPDLVAPSNNNVEEMENLAMDNLEMENIEMENVKMEDLESENVEGTSNDPLLSSFVGKGYMCPLCHKNLSKKRCLKKHLESIHPSEEITQRLVADLDTRLKFRKRGVILREWRELYPPDVASATSTNPSTSVGNLTSPNSLVLTNGIPAKSGLEASQEKVASENKDRLLKNYIMWKEQLEYKRNTKLSKGSRGSQSKTQLSQPQLQTDSPLSIHLLKSNPEVYDPFETNKEDVKYLLKDASSYMFCASLRGVPVERRLVLKRKLMEMVNAVLIGNIDPERLFIAYTP